MDPQRFAEQLPGLFDRFPASPHPRDRRFEAVLGAVPGLACENNLALVNLAASLLDPGESYVEIGTFRGTSLIAAQLGNDGDFVAVDNFSFRDGSRAALDANLVHFGLDGRATVIEGDAFTLVPSGALGDRRVGVYYYDASHAYEDQLRGLRMIEPHLAGPALMIVDDTDWERVAAATRDYLEGQPRARLLVSVEGKERGQPAWWEGMQVIAWEPE